MLTVGSLFSGIGGLDLGLEWAGIGPVQWQVENDSSCRKVLERRWPNAEKHEDVRAVGISNLSPVDIICGGFPCQDVSGAGKGAGLNGERSGLWFEFRRIVEELPRRLRLSKTSRPVSGVGCPMCGETCTCWDTEPVPLRYLPQMSERRISDEGFSLLPTPSASDYGSNQGGAAGRIGKKRPSLSTMARQGLWPTPTVCGNYNRKGSSPQSGDGLRTAVMRWATPCASDDHGPKGKPTNGGRHLPREAGGNLSPMWVEWLMGFPLDWTDPNAGPDSDS